MSAFQHLTSFTTKMNNLYVNLTIFAAIIKIKIVAETFQFENSKNASQWDLNLGTQIFSAKMNSVAVLFENPKKCKK